MPLHPALTPYEHNSVDPKAAVPSCGYPRFLRLGRFFLSVLSVSGGAGSGCGFGTGSGFRRNGSLGCGFFSDIS